MYPRAANLVAGTGVEKLDLKGEREGSKHIIENNVKAEWLDR